MTADDTPRWAIDVCDVCGNVLDGSCTCCCEASRFHEVVVVPASALDDLRAENERLRAFAFGDAPEWEKANCSLKHEARELRADLDAAIRERDEARAERDRYKAALERIASRDAPLSQDDMGLARAALAVPAPPTTTEKKENNDEH